MSNGGVFRVQNSRKLSVAKWHLGFKRPSHMQSRSSTTTVRDNGRLSSPLKVVETPEDLSIECCNSVCGGWGGDLIFSCCKSTVYREDVLKVKGKALNQNGISANSNNSHRKE